MRFRCAPMRITCQRCKASFALARGACKSDERRTVRSNSARGIAERSGFALALARRDTAARGDSRYRATGGRVPLSTVDGGDGDCFGRVAPGVDRVAGRELDSATARAAAADSHYHRVARAREAARARE